MIAVPFVFFILILALVWMFGKRINVPFIIVSIFAISALFSIFIDVLDCRPAQTYFYDISFGATVVYCFLFLLCIFPLIIYSNESTISLNPVENEKLLKIVSIVFFSFFLFFILMSVDLIMNVLTGDMKQMRMLVYAGENEFWTVKLPTFMKIPASILSSLSLNSWIFLFLAFYSLCIQKLKKRYVLMFFFSSLYAPVLGIIGADRSTSTYWIISFVIMFVYFQSSMSKKERKLLLRIGIFAAIGAFSYLVAMTNSRFNDSYYGGASGSSGGTIIYLGQTFIHFAQFFDTLNLPEKKLSVAFPLISKIFFQNSESAVAVQRYLSNITGYQLGVFYAFFGHIMISAGKTVMFFYCGTYSLLSFVLLQRKHTSNKNIVHSVSIMEAYLFLFFSSILFLGLFVHYYSSSGRMLSVLFWGGLIFFLQRGKNETYNIDRTRFQRLDIRRMEKK